MTTQEKLIHFTSELNAHEYLIRAYINRKSRKSELLLSKIKKLGFAPTVARIMKGEPVGRKSHWCSPAYRFNVKEYKKYGYKDKYSFITNNASPDDYSFDNIQDKE